MKRLLLAVVAALSLTACHKDKGKEPVSRYFDDGSAKPVIAIAPVIESTSFEYPWSLSDEFTTHLENIIGSRGDIVIAKEDFSQNYKQNPFGADISWIKSSFKNNDFVVFVEFVLHQKVPVLKALDNPNIVKERSYNLNSAIRLRIIDVRKDQPRIVLQEMLTDSHFISKNILKPNYSRFPWGTEEYRFSPIGQAHSEFAKTIAERIVDYVMLSKSR